MDIDDGWWGYVYPKNLKNHDYPKLMVPRLVSHLFCAMDTEGDFYLDNVDVGGILVSDNSELPYLTGIINSPVCNFIWQRISKPFRGNYRSANKQFIAPLPVPDAPDSGKTEVGQRAKKLQELHTHRRDMVQKFDARLNSPQTKKNKRQDRWLWADIGTVTDWKKSPEAPSELKGRELGAWAKSRRDAVRDGQYEELNARLHAGALLTVENTEDELHLKIDGCPVLTRYDDPDTELIAAQWRHALRDMNVTESFDAKKLVKLLTNLRKTDHEQLRDRLIEIDAEIETVDVQIEKEESELNDLIYELYGLTEEEVGIVKMG